MRKLHWFLDHGQSSQGQIPFIDETCLGHEKKVVAQTWLPIAHRCLNFRGGLLFKYPQSPASISARFTFVSFCRLHDDLSSYLIVLIISLKIQAVHNWERRSKLTNACLIKYRKLKTEIKDKYRESIGDSDWIRKIIITRLTYLRNL